MTKKQGALISIISNTSLMTMKVIAGLITNSISIISEAIHSLIDLTASIVAFIAIKKALKPPDEDHPYGHGKYESISGFFEGILIFLAASLIIYESIKRIIEGIHIEEIEIGIAVMLISGGINLIVSSVLFNISKKEESLALKADALHLSTDVLTSVGVGLGLLIINFTKLTILDPIIAIIIALIIIRASINLLKETIQELSDKSLPENELEEIKNIINSNPDVLEFHKLRTRKIGKQREIDFHLVLREEITLLEGHKISHTISDRIQERFPESKVTIHIEPHGEDKLGED
ncbi:MAG: cation diffusion facilitator family transporter [Brevinematia bacterium]